MKKTTRIFSILLIAAMLLGLLVGTALPAAATEEGYSGTPVTPSKINSDNYHLYGFTADNWTAYDGYYAIASAEELYGWASTKGNAVLINDIIVNIGDMVAAGEAGTPPAYTWTPIGDYTGVFDGRGYSIRGLYVSAEWSGFIKTLGRDSIIKNLTIDNAYIYGSTQAGGIVNGTHDNAEIINCVVGANVKVSGNSVGGIAYNAKNAKLTNCVVFGTVYSTDTAGRYVGAIVGNQGNPVNVTCSNCYYIKGNTTDVSGKVFKALTYNQKTNDYAGKAEGLASASASHTCIAMEHPEVAATCQSAGRKAYSDCMVCGKIMSGEKGETSIGDHTYNETGLCAICGAQAVAKVGEAYYLTLNEAISAAAAAKGSTLKLLADVERDRDNVIDSGNFTIDLAGKTLKTDGYTLSIRGSGTKITIINSTQEMGSVISTDLGAAAVVVMWGAEVVIRDGQYNGAKALNIDDAESVATIFGGVFTTNSDRTVQNGGTLRIEGGTFTAGNWSAVIVGSGSVTTVITDGTFTAGSKGHLEYWGGNLDLSGYADAAGLQLMNGSSAEVPLDNTCIKLPAGYCCYDMNGQFQTSMASDKKYTVQPCSHPSFDNGFCSDCDGYQPAVLNGDTYEISNAGQLYWFAAYVNAGNGNVNARLMANITVNQNVLTASGDLNGDPASFRAWIPIASVSNVFGGRFDGNGYTVSGLYAKAYGVGFFRYITYGGGVYNLGILDSYFENTGYASGAIAGYLSNSSITVENCFSNATIAGNSYISGGLLGSANSYATVKNCFYFGKTVGDPFMYREFNAYKEKCGNNYYVSTKDDGRPETTAISAEILASGELAYLLNGSVSGATTWGQVIGTDAYPTLMAGEGEKVYRITLCDGTQGYSNEEKITQHDPSVIAADRFTADGKCLVCGTQAAARLTDGETVTYYQNIDHALTAAQATTDATVKLLTDVILGNVEIRGTFTLDLNGFTLKSMDNFNYAIMLRGGHLTITDTSAAQTGTVLKNAKDRDAISVSGASLTINAGTYGEVSGNGEDTYITINGGNFGSAEMNTGNLTVKAGQFAVLWYAPTNLEECMAEDSYVYDSNNELVDSRQIRRIENVTVRQGADLKYAEMTLEYTETAYTALEKRPTVALTINGRAVAASNYDVAYSNNLTVGTEATVTVTGKGSYSGSNSTTFEITKGALQVVMNPETTYEFGATYTDVVNKGEVVIVGNESAIITGTWTWVEAGNTALFTPDAQYEGLFEELTNVSVTHVVTAATPVIEVVTPAPSMGPGQRIRMSVVVKNPHDGELTDLPTAFRLTYKIGENGTPVTVDGLEFTLPADTLLGEKVYVTVENVAVSGKYVATTSVNTIELLVGQVDYSTQIKALEEQIAQLKATHGADVTALEEELAALKAAVAALNDTYATDEELAKAVENLNETIAALNQRITNLENTYATKTALENAIKALEEAIAAGDAAGTKALEEAVAALNKALEEAVAALEKAYKDADDALKSNLETLINTTKTTLEQAIAALDARVAQNEADIALLQASLEAAIRNLEAAIAAGDEANAEALKKAVEELTELLNKAVAALEKADETNRTELETLINQAKTTLEQAIAALDARVTQNETDIALLKASLEAAIRNLEAAIAAGDAANAKALENAINLLTQMLNEAVAALEKADETNRTALEALIQTAKETLEAAIAQLRQDLENAVEELENADQANAEALAEAVKNLTAAIEAAEAAAAAEDAAIRTELAEAKAALELSISRLRGELYTIRNDLTTSMKAGDAALDQKITQLASALEAAVAALEAADQAQKAELTAAIEAAEATLNAAIEKVAIDLADAYETLRLSLANGDKALHTRIDTLTAALNAAIAASEAADEAMRTELHTRISQAEAALNSAILQLQNNLEATKAALNAKDEQLNKMVIVAIVLGGLGVCGNVALLVVLLKRKK